MSVRLKKGKAVALNKNVVLEKITVGLGWNENSNGTAFDLDASAFLLKMNGKVLGDEYIVFYNQLNTPNNSVEHTGDNKVGGMDGDSEAIKVNLTLLPSTINKIVFTVTIHDAKKRRQNFGQVSNAYIRIVNDQTNEELVRYDLSEDYSTETAMIFGELYLENGLWNFKAIGKGFNEDLGYLCSLYGVNVE